MKSKRNPPPQRGGNTTAEFALVALELAALNPDRLFALVEELTNEDRALERSHIPNKTS